MFFHECLVALADIVFYVISQSYVLQLQKANHTASLAHFGSINVTSNMI